MPNTLPHQPLPSTAPLRRTFSARNSCKSWVALRDAISAGSIRIGDVFFMQGLKFDIRDTTHPGIVNAEIEPSTRSQGDSAGHKSDMPIGRRTRESSKAAGSATQLGSHKEYPPTSTSGKSTETSDLQIPAPQQDSSKASASISQKTYAAVASAISAPRVAEAAGLAMPRSSSASGRGNSQPRTASRGPSRGSSPARRYDSARGRDSAIHPPHQQPRRSRGGSPAQGSPSRPNSAGIRTTTSTTGTRLHWQNPERLKDQATESDINRSRGRKAVDYPEEDPEEENPHILTKGEKSAFGIERHHGIVLEMTPDCVLFAATSTFRSASTLVGKIADESLQFYWPINWAPENDSEGKEPIRMASGNTRLRKWVYLRHAIKIKFDDPQLERIFVEGPTGERYDQKAVEFIKDLIRKNGPLDPDERKEVHIEPTVGGREGSAPASEQQPTN